jgi:hypothetical protein
MTDIHGTEKKLTVCVYLTGQSPQRAHAILQTLHATPGMGAQWDAIVGVDSTSYDLSHFTHHHHQHGSRATFIETKASVGKERFVLSMVANTHSHYVLIIDDGVFLSKDWLDRLEAFITRERPDGISGALVTGTLRDKPDSVAHTLALHASAVLLKTSFLRTWETTTAATTLASCRTLFDSALTTSLGLDTFSADLFDPCMLQLTYGTNQREHPVSNTQPLLSACLCTYGDHPDLILRCLDSILREPRFADHMEILVGCNNVSPRVLHEIEQRFKRERITALIRAPINFNKAGMQRFTFRLARGPYILSLDDDMYFKPGWFPIFKDFVLSSHPFEAAGRLHELSSRRGWSGKKKPYHEFVERKRWWRGVQPREDKVNFPAGQCFLARRDFVVGNDYPDLGMKIDWDDVLLGDMITQLGGKLLFFSDPLYEHVVIDDIASRGQHGGG